MGNLRIYLISCPAISDIYFLTCFPIFFPVSVLFLMFTLVETKRLIYFRKHLDGPDDIKFDLILSIFRDISIISSLILVEIKWVYNLLNVT